MKMLYVKWIDTKSKSGWMDKNELISTVCTAESVGWFVSEDEKALTLAQSIILELDLVGELIAIPKIAILKRRVLK